MNNENVFKKACLIQLSTSCWIGSKMLTQGVMENIGNSEWLKGKKLLVNPELLSPIKTTIQKARCAARKVQTNIALVLSAFPLNGLFLSYAACLKPLKYTSSGVW